MADQYIRKVGLVVAGGDGRGVDLSQLRVVFKVSAADTQSPNTADIRVYNLDPSLARQIAREFKGVTLQAGYEGGKYGVVFQGSIKQTETGRVSATDSFLSMFAADGDQAFNFGMVNTSRRGVAPADQANAIAGGMGPYGVTAGDTTQVTGGVLPRGKVLFGMGRARASDLAASTGTSWSIQNGKLVFVPLTGYLPGEAVVLNSRTGLVGVPSATEDGITATCLLNPSIRIGGRVQINNADINTRTVQQQGGFPNYSSISLPATVTDDGIYRVLVAEHRGDSRGDEWYTDVVCLAIDASASPGSSVKVYG